MSDDHQAALLLTADPELARELVTSALAPLDGERGAMREKLEITLAAWLERPAQQKALAQHLGVHPKTVRYRVERLRDLFGAATLDNPANHLELRLALALRQLLRGDGYEREDVGAA